MGYSFVIGEACIQYNAGESVSIWAELAEHPDAPDHCKYTGKGNSRSPSYTGWEEFCQEAGIYELFYGQGWDRDLRRYAECSEAFYLSYGREEPILISHPGATPLGEGDLRCVREARIRREQTNAEIDGVDNGLDHILARLVWLEFWFDWALKNCKRPVMVNS